MTMPKSVTSISHSLLSSVNYSMGATCIIQNTRLRIYNANWLTMDTFLNLTTYSSKTPFTKDLLPYITNELNLTGFSFVGILWERL